MHSYTWQSNVILFAGIWVRALKVKKGKWREGSEEGATNEVCQIKGMTTSQQNRGREWN